MVILPGPSLRFCLRFPVYIFDPSNQRTVPLPCAFPCTQAPLYSEFFSIPTLFFLKRYDVWRMMGGAFDVVVTGSSLSSSWWCLTLPLRLPLAKTAQIHRVNCDNQTDLVSALVVDKTMVSSGIKRVSSYPSAEKYMPWHSCCRRSFCNLKYLRVLACLFEG